MTMRVSLGWAIFDPVSMTKVRRKVGYGYHMRQSSKIYASQKVAERYLMPGTVAKEVFVEVSDGPEDARS